ncbi:MAG: hypothetical protein J6N19_04930 [Clostridium sp.]|nr:hypothetical protein [Clostridium sp.]
MAYNGFNPYGTYPQYPYSMNNQYGTVPTMTQQSNAQQAQPLSMIWVDGEVGAKAYQMPSGWPVNTPLPLWDTNSPVVYFKSTNTMGMPNPLQKARYSMESTPQAPAAMSMLPGDTQTAENHQEDGHGQSDMSQYVTRQDLDRFREEITSAMSSAGASRTKGGRSNDVT